MNDIPKSAIAAMWVVLALTMLCGIMGWHSLGKLGCITGMSMGVKALYDFWYR